MPNLDLSDIDPLKWAEVRRRVAVLERYLAIERPTAADRGRHGAMLDLGAQQFTNLVRAWSHHHDARDLAPGLRKRRTDSISVGRRGGVEPDARAEAKAVIAAAASDESLADLVAAVRSRCESIGIKPPSRGTVWHLLMEGRGRRAVVEAREEDVLVARAFLKLPVDDGSSSLFFPGVTLAVERPTGRIAYMALDDADGRFDRDALAAALHPIISRRHLPVTADETILQSLGADLPPGSSMTPLTPTPARSLLADTVGRRVGLLELAYKPLSADPRSSMQSARDRAPTLVDAANAVEMARERHNCGVAPAD